MTESKESEPALALGQDVNAMCAQVSAALTCTRDALVAQLDRSLRRLMLTVGAIMVAAGAAIVLLARSGS